MRLMTGVAERAILVEGNPAYLSAEYYLQGLRIDDTQRMRRIEGACLLFVTKAQELLFQNPSFIMDSSNSTWPVAVPVKRYVIMENEVVQASRVVLNEYWIQGLGITPEVETLAGLRLCLISAIQLLGVEKTKTLRDFPQKTNDARAVLLGFFNSHYALEKGKVMKKIGEAKVYKFEETMDGLMMIT